MSHPHLPLTEQLPRAQPPQHEQPHHAHRLTHPRRVPKYARARLRGPAGIRLGSSCSFLELRVAIHVSGDRRRVLRCACASSRAGEDPRRRHGGLENCKSAPTASEGEGTPCHSLCGGPTRLRLALSYRRLGGVAPFYANRASNRRDLVGWDRGSYMDWRWAWCWSWNTTREGRHARRDGKQVCDGHRGLAWGSTDVDRWAVLSLRLVYVRSSVALAPCPKPRTEPYNAIACAPSPRLRFKSEMDCQSGLRWVVERRSNVGLCAPKSLRKLHMST